MCICLHVDKCIWMQVPSEASDSLVLGAGFMGSWRPPDITLRTELWSSGKTASALNSSAISAALFFQFLDSYSFFFEY